MKKYIVYCIFIGVVISCSSRRSSVDQLEFIMSQKHPWDSTKILLNTYNDVETLFMNRGALKGTTINDYQILLRKAFNDSIDINLFNLTQKKDSSYIDAIASPSIYGGLLVNYYTVSRSKSIESPLWLRKYGMELGSIYANQYYMDEKDYFRLLNIIDNNDFSNNLVYRLLFLQIAYIKITHSDLRYHLWEPIYNVSFIPMDTIIDYNNSDFTDLKNKLSKYTADDMVTIELLVAQIDTNKTYDHLYRKFNYKRKESAYELIDDSNFVDIRLIDMTDRTPFEGSNIRKLVDDKNAVLFYKIRKYNW